MAAIARVLPVSFGDTTLPRVSLKYVRPIGGAINDWASDGLAAGSLPGWADMVAGRVLPARPGEGRAPTVTTDGIGSMVSFDGAANWMQISYPMNQPMTTIIVARMNDSKPTNHILAGGVHIRTNAANTRMESSAGTILGTTAAPLDTNWHCWIIVNNGDNSVMGTDGVEALGAGGSGARTFINLGVDGAGAVGMRNDYRRLAFLPYAAGANERAALYAQMRAQYGIA